MKPVKPGIPETNYDVETYFRRSLYHVLTLTIQGCLEINVLFVTWSKPNTQCKRLRTKSPNTQSFHEPCFIDFLFTTIDDDNNSRNDETQTGESSSPRSFVEMKGRGT